MKFEIVTDPDEARRIRSVKRIGPLAAALLEGQMVHMPNMRQSQVGGRFMAVQKRGYRVRSRSDGNGGTYVWAEKIEQEAPIDDATMRPGAERQSRSAPVQTEVPLDDMGEPSWPEPRRVRER